MLRKAANKSEPLDCRQVDALLGAYLEGGLSPEQEAAVRAHLDDCPTCRQAAIQDTELIDRLQVEATGQQRKLSPAAAARVQEGVYRRMRRRTMARRVGRLAWGVAGVLLLALMIGGVYYWQREVQSLRRPTPTRKPTAAPSKEIEAVVINFACPDLDCSRYESLAQTFSKANPDVEIQLLPLTSLWENYQDGDASAQAALAAADTAALRPTPADTRQDLLLDLTPFVQADSDFDAGDFYPLAWDAYRWDGGTWALPSSLSFAFLFYDRTAFDAAGLSYPTSDWSWEDLRRAAIALTVREGDEVVRYGFVGNVPGAVAVVVQSLAGSLWDTVEGRLVPDLRDPAVADALRWYVDLALNDGVMPATNDFLQLDELVKAGHAAMWLGAADQYRGVAGEMNVGVVPLPQNSTPLSVKSYAVSANTVHPQESWRWIEFLTRQVVNPKDPLEWPAHRSVALAGDYRTLLTTKVGSEMRAAYEHSLSWATWAPDKVVGLPLEEALVRVLAGETSPEAALADAQRQAERDLKITVSVPVQIPTSTVTRPPAPKRVVFLSYADVETYQALAQTFSADRAGVSVIVKPQIFMGEFNQVQVAEESDCFAFPADVSIPAQENLFLDLGHYLSADPDFPLDDYYSLLLDVCRSREGVWCLPFDAHIEMLFYNRRLFDQAGLPYPALDWSTADFVEIAQALTAGQGEEKQFGFVSLASESRDLLSFLVRDGALLFDSSDAGGAVWPSFAGPTVVSALRRYADLRLADGAMPPLTLTSTGGASGKDWTQREQVVLDGRAGMWTRHVGSQYFYGPRTLPANFPLGVAPLPGEPGAVENGWVIAYYISAQTPHPDVCWEWIAFLGDRLETVVGIPARRSLVASAELKAKAGTEAALAYRAVLENGVEVGYPVAFPAGYDWAVHTMDWLWEAYVAVLEGADVEVALSAAQARAETLFRCVGSETSPNNERLKNCLLEADPNYDWSD